MTDIDIIRKQRDIVFEACKQVATNKNCPSWAAKILSTAAMQAKKLQDTEYEVTDNFALSKTKELNSIVATNKYNDKCIYKIIKIGQIIQDVQLYDLVVIKGNKSNPEGSILYNVPESWIVTSN